jgi:ATP sulfurylase
LRSLTRLEKRRSAFNNYKQAALPPASHHVTVISEKWKDIIVVLLHNIIRVSHNIIVVNRAENYNRGKTTPT